MELLKLIKNRITSEWKETFNSNIDILNRILSKVNGKIDVLNKRIDNLVIKSGGDSPNEVVDARVNNNGETFDTLESRLLAAENKHDDELESANLNILNNKDQLGQLNDVIEALYNAAGTSITIYVSASRGSDSTGDGTEEKPYSSIQMAANTIPLINSSVITIFVEEGVYLEDVVFYGIISQKITLRSVYSVRAEDVYQAKLPVHIRSVSFLNCNSNINIYGIHFVEKKNFGSRIFQSVYISNNGMLTVENCAFDENVKSFETHRSVYSSGNSKAHVKQCLFSNQKIVFYADTTSEIRVGGNNQGSNNDIVNCAENGTIRTNTGVTGSNTNQTVGAGLIITKGTVLS